METTPAAAEHPFCSEMWFISGGAPLPFYIIEAYQKCGVVFKQGYGLTEVGVNCFSMTVEESARKAGSIGKPLMFTQARLVDARGNDVPVGEVGELLLRGSHVCQGYWNNAQATAAAWTPRAGSTPATWRAATTRAFLALRVDPRTCSSAAG